MDPQVFYDLTQNVSFDYSCSVYPLVIASHPSDSNQFTLGMTNGGVYVIKPLELEGKWGVGPPLDNVTIGSNPTLSNQGLELAPR